MRQPSGAEPTSVLFLCSGMPALESVAARFVGACGGKAARIALLTVPGMEQHGERCRQTLGRTGVGEIRSIVPPANLILDDEQLRSLKEATGIFMAGGPAAQYLRTYGAKRVSREIRQRHAAGVPYGGLSSGSMVAAELCDVGHSLVKTRTNEYQLAAEGHASPPGVDLRPGLGLVRGSVLQPHLSEWGQLPELLEDVRLGRARVGLGLDNSICLELRDGTRAWVQGRGRLYVVRRRAKGARVSVSRSRPTSPGLASIWRRAGRYARRSGSGARSGRPSDSSSCENRNII